MKTIIAVLAILASLTVTGCAVTDTGGQTHSSYSQQDNFEPATWLP